MPTYVSLMSWTQQGVQSVKDAPDRVAAASAAIQAAGGELKAIYVTMGQYDIVAVTELANDEMAAGILLALAGQGNLRSETMRAFTMDEFAGIVSNLP